MAVWRHGGRGHSGQYGAQPKCHNSGRGRSRAVAGDETERTPRCPRRDPERDPERDPRVLGAIDMSHTPPASQSSGRSGAHDSVPAVLEGTARIPDQKLAPVSLSVSGLSDRLHSGIVPPGRRARLKECVDAGN